VVFNEIGDWRFESGSGSPTRVGRGLKPNLGIGDLRLEISDIRPRGGVD
jgi:hypothetical protein